MTQIEIIFLAIEAGFTEKNVSETSDNVFIALPSDLEVFAKLVAEREREACAKSLENIAEATTNFQAKVLIEMCATHIRARGKA